MKLKQVATIEAGYPFRGKIPDVQSAEVVVVQMKDVSVLGGVDWSVCARTNLTGKREPAWLQSGDILVAARGSQNYAVLIDSAVPQQKIRAVAAPHFFVLSVKNNVVLPEYLVWFLNQQPCQRYFEQNAEGSLTKSIRRGVLEEVPIAVPPLAKQQLIVKLANTIRQEQQVLEQLVSNGERLMNNIAAELLS
jgi:hypothetical protein